MARFSNSPRPTRTARWFAFVRPSHKTRSKLYQHTLGILPALEFFENSLFVLFALYISVGVSATSREFVWMTTAYSMASIFAILKQQWFVERVGYRAYLATSLMLYGVFAIGAGMSNNFTELIICRGLQGFCAGSWMSSARILAQISISANERPRALKSFVMIIFLTNAIAPIVGSFLIEHYTWRVLLYLPAPLAIVLSLLVMVTFPKIGLKPERGEERYPFIPFMVFALSLGLIQIAIQEARFSSWSGTPWRLVLLAGFVGIGYFVQNQWHHPSPLLHMQTLRIREYLTGLVFFMLYYTLANALSYLLPQLCEQGLGFTVTQMGYSLGISAMIGWLALPVYFLVSPRIRQKRFLIAFGFAIVALAAWDASMLSPEAGRDNVWGILLLRGIFGAFLILPVANLTFRGFDDHKFVHGYRLKNIVRQLAGSLSISLVVSVEQIRNAVHHERLTETSTLLDARFSAMFDELQQHFLALGFTAGDAYTAALEEISGWIDRQAGFLSMLDTFHGLALMAVLGLVFALWQRRLN